MNYYMIKDGKGGVIGSGYQNLKKSGLQAAKILKCKKTDLHVLGYIKKDGNRDFYWFDGNKAEPADFIKDLKLGDPYMNCRPKVFTH